MGNDSWGILLVGHGGVPRDYPRERLSELRALEAQRRARRCAPSAREEELERDVRHWPRTPQSDPYGAGFRLLAEQVRALQPDIPLVVAYNEFCAPAIPEGAAKLVALGCRRIVVLPSMLTPGGVHSEIDIPEALEEVRSAHPDIEVRYAWPFDLGEVARLLVTHAHRIAGADS